MLMVGLRDRYENGMIATLRIEHDKQHSWFLKVISAKDRKRFLLQKERLLSHEYYV